MFSYIYMKILESAPKRYDLGISLLSLGRINKVKRKIAEDFIKDEDKVLDVGCGTGTLAVMMAERGATVEGFDISKDMLKVAKEKIRSRNLGNNIKLKELGVAEMNNFPDESFDKVVSTLVFSELSNDEQRFALKESWRVLKRGGLLIIGDEVTPEIDTCCLNCLVISTIKKTIYHLIRIPLLVLTFILTQTTTKPVKSLEDKVTETGFEIIQIEKSFFDSFKTVIAKKER